MDIQNEIHNSIGFFQWNRLSGFEFSASIGNNPMKLTFMPPIPYFHWINPMEVAGRLQYFTKCELNFPNMTLGTSPLFISGACV
jgi:hypothetical protein